MEADSGKQCYKLFSLAPMNFHHMGIMRKQSDMTVKIMRNINKPMVHYIRVFFCFHSTHQTQIMEPSIASLCSLSRSC